MIKKETEKRILQEICTNQITPVLEKFNFKFLKSKSLFIRKGKELDIILTAYNLSQPFSMSEADELQFNFSLRSSLQLTKYDKWHKKLFKRNSTNLVNAKFKAYNFKLTISEDTFKQNDFYEPSASRAFKNKIANSLRSNVSQPEIFGIEFLEKFVSDEVVPEYSQYDNLQSLIEFNRIPKIVKAELFYYSGQLENSRLWYKELHKEINDQIKTAEEEYKLSNYSRILSEIESKYKLLFNEVLNADSTKTKVEISKSDSEQIIIAKYAFDRIGTFTKIIPPINYYSNLAQDEKRGIDIQNDSIIIYHKQNILSEWSLSLSMLHESEYKHTKRVIPAEIVQLLPKEVYDSVICESRDGEYIFAGGYHTKSFLINKKTKTKKVLWAHETFKDGYKNNYQVSHNFGVNQAKYILNEKYLLACACHAKNVIWDTITFTRKELLLPFEYTFKGAPPSTEFANDVKQICVLDKLQMFGLVIRNQALILNESFEVTNIIDNVKQIRTNKSNSIIAIIRENNRIEIYKRNTTGTTA
jgi:hypothetical protein